MSKSKSYRSRANADCVVMDAVEDQPCWGIVRFSSLGHYLCEGHRTPPDYVAEISEEERAAKAAEAEITAQSTRTSREATAARLNVAVPLGVLAMSDEQWATWVAHEEARWFRASLANIENTPTGLFWSDLSDVMLLFLHSAIGDGLRCGDGKPPVNERLQVLGLRATAEIYRRKLQWPEGAYDLILAPEWIDVGRYTAPFGDKVLRLGFHHLSDNEVELLYGCAAVVADFSCLERGVRQCVMHVLEATEAELRRREVEAEFLMGQS